MSRREGGRRSGGGGEIGDSVDLVLEVGDGSIEVEPVSPPTARFEGASVVASGRFRGSGMSGPDRSQHGGDRTIVAWFRDGRVSGVGIVRDEQVVAMDETVMGTTQQHEVGKVGWPAVCPVDDVMGVEVAGGRTAGVTAGPVADTQCPTQRDRARAGKLPAGRSRGAGGP